LRWAGDRLCRCVAPHRGAPSSWNQALGPHRTEGSWSPRIQRASRPDRHRLPHPPSPLAPLPRLGRSATPHADDGLAPRPIGHGARLRGMFSPSTNVIAAGRPIPTSMRPVPVLTEWWSCYGGTQEPMGWQMTGFRPIPEGVEEVEPDPVPHALPDSLRHQQRSPGRSSRVCRVPAVRGPRVSGGREERDTQHGHSSRDGSWLRPVRWRRRGCCLPRVWATTGWAAITTPTRAR
jgi:hypothetical protein